jgi:hypothetical protein
MGDKQAPGAPELPPQTLAHLREFVECTGETVTFEDGKLGWVGWVPIPDAVIVHKPLAGGYPSYLESVFEFDPLTIPRGAVLVLVLAEEGSADVTYKAPITEGRAKFQTGITDYGLKLYKNLKLKTGTTPPEIGALTPFHVFFGESATVTEEEGSLAGNDCPTPILTP